MKFHEVNLETSHDSRKQTVVPAVERALNILESLGTHGTSMTLKEIAATLDIPAVSTFRIVKYLCSRGYLKEEPHLPGQYNLGMQLLYIAHQLHRNSDLRVAAILSMRKLAEVTGQTSQLAILQDYGVMYVEQATPLKPVNIIAQLRTQIPVNVSASGKVLIAYLQPEEQNEYLKKIEFVCQTKRSITNPAEFGKELLKVRQLGFAVDNEEYARGIGCLAAPIFDHLAKNIAAVGITGHIADYHNEAKFENLKHQVLVAAKEISENLGCSDYR
jgi:DNA-binding IclR family transcriptional regulator